MIRVAYATVDLKEKENPVVWGPTPIGERISTVVGDSISRSKKLERVRFEYESELAEKLLPILGPSDYLLLDGASYFGRLEDRRFAFTLYEKARRRNQKFLAISKNSPSLIDNRGRDLTTQFTVDISTVTTPSAYPIPELKANTDKHRFGDVYLVKLNPESFRVFRCDMMDYLRSEDLVELLSPLTVISGDPRCLGYPGALFLAHNFAKVDSDAKLLHHRDSVEKALDDEGLLHFLKMEESLSNFRSEMYGRKYPWELGGH